MISIKFKDNIIKDYSINKLKEIPFFKSLIEDCNEINNIIPFDDFDSDVIDCLIYNVDCIDAINYVDGLKIGEADLDFDKYDFNELYRAKEFLELYHNPSIQKKFKNQLERFNYKLEHF